LYVLYTEKWQNYTINEDDLGKVRNLHWKVIKNVSDRSLKLNGRDQFADHDIDGRIMLMCIVDEV
jgi:hypothetical protein